MLYLLLKHIIHFGLVNYHRSIKVYGLKNVPKNKPVLFLPNHQNALIDVLLIAVNCNRKPFFLARSDVFSGSLLNKLFSYLRMIPIYRMRDGRDKLSKNDAVFDACARILNKGEALVLFPEGNHNLQRRVRPLSKGFTRVLFRALELYPDLDVQIVPVGLNYRDALTFPDAASVYYGKPISVGEFYDADNMPGSANSIRDMVTGSLQSLTTHIASLERYESTLHYLQAQKVDFLNPAETNRFVKEADFMENIPMVKTQKLPIRARLLKTIFLLLNFPAVLSWRYILRPKVREAEFMGTFRFATALSGFFIYVALLFTVVLYLLNFWWALSAIGLLWLFNLWYVKRLA